jgi:hypothetical protein
MQNKLNIYLIVGFGLLLMTWLFVGFSYDDEFFEPTLFTKYKPTFKVNFHSPIGQSDLTLEDLSPSQQFEEKAFQEFVKNHDGQFILSGILIQLTITFLCLGVYQLRRSVLFKIWQILKHILLNFVITTFGLVFILHFYQIFVGGLITVIVVAINYLSLSFLVKGKI